MTGSLARTELVVRTIAQTAVDNETYFGELDAVVLAWAGLARIGRADEVTEVLEHAARAAAVTVSRPGADPPYRHELR